MRKVYKELTKEQKERGVMFSSCLMPGTTIHEVLATDNDKWEVIDRLRYAY
jgi:hypothetical protein